MKFGTIIVDPPWPYEVPRKTHVKGKGYMSYKALSLDDLASLRIKEISADDGVIFLWATGPFMAAAPRLLESWGFQHVTVIAWHKLTAKGNPSYGAGAWFRGSDEFILVGRRPQRRCIRTHQRNSFESPGLRHSEKPDYLHRLVEGKVRESVLFPTPWLEVFARQGRDNWTTIGNENIGSVPLSRCEDVRDSIAWLMSHEGTAPSYFQKDVA